MSAHSHQCHVCEPAILLNSPSDLHSFGQVEEQALSKEKDKISKERLDEVRPVLKGSFSEGRN